MNFNLVTIRPKGFLHASAFAEVKDSLAWALTALGHEANLTENAFSSAEATNIIFGAELLSPGTRLPPGSVIYNLEQPSHPNTANVRSLATANQCRVWDYSLRNNKDWAAAAISAIHVPIGYTPNLTRVPKSPTQDWDVCFMGWLTPRRVKLIDDLRRIGLKVFASDRCYGGARDNILSRSKLVLNVHHDGRNMFEIVRVSYLLANSKCVISEESSDEQDYRDLSLVQRVPYDSLVDACVLWVRTERDGSAGRMSLDTIQKRDYVRIVAAALDAPATTQMNRTLDVATDKREREAKAATSQSAIQARFIHGCAGGDMKDFLPWLKEHAYGQILEIGTRDGASTSAFLLGLEFAGGHLTSIDPDERCASLWRHPQWTFICDTSLAIRFQSEFHSGQFDLALIDGDHTEPAVIGDLYNCYHWVRPGGLILVHDVKPERGHEFYAVQLRERFDWFAKVNGLRSEILPGMYGLGVLYR